VDEILRDIALKVPELGVLVWVVMRFLAHQEKLAAAHREEWRQQLTELSEIVARNTNAFHEILRNQPPTPPTN
jgi:hypothetical protein